MSISTTKDIIFSGFLCMTFTYLAHYFRLPKFINVKNNIIYIIGIVGTILFRNNGIFPIIALLIILIFLSIKKRKLSKLLKLSLLGFIIGIICFMSLKCGLKAKSGSIGEALSVPMHQIACAYVDNKNKLSSDEKNTIEEFFPNVNDYCSYMADIIKGGRNYIKYNKNDFLSLYSSLLSKYPISYIKAFLLLDAGYFLISDDTFIHACDYIKDAKTGYFSYSSGGTFDSLHKSYIPIIENFYVKLFVENEYQHIFILNFLMNPAIYFYLMMSLMFYTMLSKQFELTPMIFFMLIFIMTMLLGPCCQARYFLPYVICIPTMFSTVIVDDRGKKIAFSG